MNNAVTQTDSNGRELVIDPIVVPKPIELPPILNPKPTPIEIPIPLPTPIPNPQPVPPRNEVPKPTPPKDKCDATVTYYHYTRAIIVGPIWAGAWVTDVSGLDTVTASGGLGIPLPKYEYSITINPKIYPVIRGTPFIVPPNKYGPGGLHQYILPNGAPASAVQGPRAVPFKS